jgi:hypothetical protein
MKYYIVQLRPVDKTKHDAEVHSVWTNEALALKIAELHNDVWADTYVATVSEHGDCGSEDFKAMAETYYENEETD